jgi:cytoskeleton protein RodZ
MPVLEGTSLGRLLREERLRQNLDFAAISARTRICALILDAIENDQFDHVPAGWYRHSFLRQYALALGMDGEAIVAEYKKQHEEPPLPLPHPPARRPRRIWADLAWVTVSGVALTGIYYVSQATHAALMRQQHAGSHAENSANRIMPTPVVPASALPPPTMPSPAPSAPAKAPDPVPPGAVHLALTAKEPVWVSIKYGGDVKWTGVLEAAQSKTFDASDAITAVIGNAGGLEISLNGKTVNPLGGHGEVQTLEFTPTGAHRISRHSD